MKTALPRNALPAAGIALGALAIAAVTGVTFSAWIDKGAAIFMTFAESGLAWCF